MRATSRVITSRRLRDFSSSAAASSSCSRLLMAASGFLSSWATLAPTCSSDRIRRAAFSSACSRIDCSARFWLVNPSLSATTVCAPKPTQASRLNTTSIS